MLVPRESKNALALAICRRLTLVNHAREHYVSSRTGHGYGQRLLLCSLQAAVSSNREESPSCWAELR